MKLYTRYKLCREVAYLMEEYKGAIVEEKGVTLVGSDQNEYIEYGDEFYINKYNNIVLLDENEVIPNETI